LRRGAWTKEEDELLKQNFDTFLKQHPVTEPQRLFNTRGQGDYKQLREFIHKTQFYIELVSGLNRLTYSCIKHARDVLFPPDKNGPFSRQEIERLVKLQKTHGNKWAKIGKIMGRTNTSLEHHAHRQPVGGKGPWSEKEQQMLVRVMKRVIKKDDLSKLYCNLPWTKIAQQIPTRNTFQCRYHWLRYICTDPNKVLY
jgi:hypothetical protein